MNILFTSAGRRAYIIDYFKRALNGNGKVHASNSYHTYALQSADHAVISPLILDENYINFIREYCLKHNISAIISLFDLDLPVFAANKQVFKEAGIRVLVPNEDVSKIVNDKWATYNYFNSKKFDTPKTYLSVDEAISSIHNGQVSFPLITKPRWGTSSIGIYTAENIEELKVLYSIAQRDCIKSFLRHNPNTSDKQNVLIQEKIIGDEICIDVLNDLNGNYLSSVSFHIQAMRAGESDTVVSVDNPVLEAIAKSVSFDLNLTGCWNIDSIRKDNRHFLLEINGRLNGLSPFSYLSGINFPQAIINMLRGEEIPPELLQKKLGITGFKNLIPVALNK